jgi:hypothetical protein
VELPTDIKTIADIGLGAVSLMLWLRQGKINAAQEQATKDLTTMVKDHDQRISSLESVRRVVKRKAR